MKFISVICFIGNYARIINTVLAIPIKPIDNRIWCSIFKLHELVVNALGRQVDEAVTSKRMHELMKQEMVRNHLK